LDLHIVTSVAEITFSQEFYATCVRDQESLVSQMGWANAQAEKSRAERGLTTPIPKADGGFEDRMGNLRVSDEEPSLPERVFLELLAASDELTQVRDLHLAILGTTTDTSINRH
jgi:hypothetical protein